MLLASEMHISTNGHRVSGLESRIPATVSKDRCRAIWKNRETQKSSRRSPLAPSFAAVVPIKSCHRFDRADFKRLAEHVSGGMPPTTSIRLSSLNIVVPQHCRVPVIDHDVRGPDIDARLVWLMPSARRARPWLLPARLCQSVHDHRPSHHCGWIGEQGLRSIQNCSHFSVGAAPSGSPIQIASRSR